MYSVYGLKDPRDMLFHYVGMGKDPYRRYAMHLLNVGGGKTEKDIWIQELRELGLSPLLEVLETVGTKKEADIRETYWIEHFFSLNMPLKNMSKIKRKQAEIEYKSPLRAPMGMEEELSQLLKSQGWNLFLRKRGKREYFYAQKWRKGEVYIAPRLRITAVTSEQVLSKLRKAE